MAPRMVHTVHVSSGMACMHCSVSQFKEIFVIQWFIWLLLVLLVVDDHLCYLFHLFLFWDREWYTTPLSMIIGTAPLPQCTCPFASFQ